METEIERIIREYKEFEKKFREYVAVDMPYIDIDLLVKHDNYMADKSVFKGYKLPFHLTPVRLVREGDGKIHL